LNASRVPTRVFPPGSALVTRLLGPPTPLALLAFGAGTQIREHVRLLLIVHPSIVRVTIINRTINARLSSLLSSLVPLFPHIDFLVGRAVGGEGLEGFDLKASVREADIICTATSSEVPLFKSEWVKSEAHVNLIGSYKPTMAEVEGDLIRRAGKVVVDSRAACLAEAGELIQAKLGEESLVEAGEMVDGQGHALSEQVDHVKQAGDVTIFKSVGLGLQDVAIAAAVVEQAEEMGLGTRVAEFDV
jgi:ornithine cyclodeaminase/alanine dehydrogenase-like protein (mu-crystallin family)